MKVAIPPVSQGFVHEPKKVAETKPEVAIPSVSQGFMHTPTSWTPITTIVGRNPFCKSGLRACL